MNKSIMMGIMSVYSFNFSETQSDSEDEERIERNGEVLALKDRIKTLSDVLVVAALHLHALYDRPPQSPETVAFLKRVDDILANTKKHD